MKAIIMAGGVGSRLRPMTCDCPKPLVPVLDRPVMEYAVRLLKKHGVREAAATLCYLPRQVEETFGDGSEYGISLRYYTETEPLGTAGGVKRAESFLRETFCVLSGDGLTDCDLTEALAFHIKKGAIATIVLKRADAPTEYGVAITEPDGRIRKFLEKPDWSDVFSDLVNTGIYILEPEALRLVPDDRPYDFSKQLFPELMRLGLQVYGWETKGYWCDIGDMKGYLDAHRALLDGDIQIAGIDPGGRILSPGARIHGSAQIESPVYIGPGAVIEEGATISAYSVIGAGARVCRDARVKRAVLWSGARLEKGAKASGCVIAEGARLGEYACAYEESVLGARAHMEARSALMPGVRVWPRKHIREYARVESDVIWGDCSAFGFRSGRVRLVDPGQAARLGQTLAQCAKGASFLTGRDTAAGSAVCSRAVTAGLLSQGANVFDAGGAALPALRHMQRLLGTERAIYIEDGRVLPMLESGAEYPREAQRKIIAEFCRERVPMGFGQTESAVQNAGRADLLYLGDITSRFGAKAGEKGDIAVYAASGALLSLAERAFQRAGYHVRAEWDEALMTEKEGETRVYLDENGESMRIAGGESVPDDSLMPLLYAWTALESGEKELVEPGGANWAVETLAEKYGARVIRAHSGRGEEQKARLAESPALHRLYTDGIYAALCALEALARKGLTLRKWQSEMPNVNVRERSVPVDFSMKGRVLRSFSEAFPQAELDDGARIATDRGRVWIRPSSERAECLVRCESMDAEFAKELCDFYADHVRRSAGGDQNAKLTKPADQT